MSDQMDYNRLWKEQFHPCHYPSGSRNKSHKTSCSAGEGDHGIGCCSSSRHLFQSHHSLFLQQIPRQRQQRQSTIHKPRVAPVVVAACRSFLLVYGVKACHGERKLTNGSIYLASCSFWMKPVKGGNGFRPFFFLSNLAGMVETRDEEPHC